MQFPRLLLLCGSLLSSCTSLKALADYELSLSGGLGITKVDTSETKPVTGGELNSESGDLFSRELAFEFSNHRYFFGGSIYNADGDITYKGVSQLGTQIPSGSTYLYIWRPNLYLGKELSDIPLSPRVWMELGGQLRERHITTNVADIQGYEEDYKWWEGGVGLELHLLKAKNYKLVAGVGYQSMVNPENSPSNLKIDLELGSTSRYNLYSQFSYALGAGFFVDAIVSYAKTSIDLSRKQYEGNNIEAIVQPASDWTDLDMMLKLRKQF